MELPGVWAGCRRGATSGAWATTSPHRILCVLGMGTPPGEEFRKCPSGSELPQGTKGGKQGTASQLGPLSSAHAADTCGLCLPCHELLANEAPKRDDSWLI